MIWKIWLWQVLLGLIWVYLIDIHISNEIYFVHFGNILYPKIWRLSFLDLLTSS